MIRLNELGIAASFRIPLKKEREDYAFQREITGMCCVIEF